jgi:hypothetical protein
LETNGSAASLIGEQPVALFSIFSDGGTVRPTA